MNKLSEFLGKFATWMNQNRIIQSISHALMSLMPALMVGALGSLLQQLPIPGYTDFLINSGLINVFKTMVNVTTNMLALYAAFAIAYQYTDSEGKDGFAAGLLSLLSFFLVTPMETTGEGFMAITNLPLSWMGAKGLFSAMIIAIVTAKIYCLFIEKKITIKMPDSVPTFISKSFMSIVPGLVIAILFAAISSVMTLTSFGNLHSAIYGIIGAPLSSIGGSVWAALIIYILSGLCWFFGIHGIAVVSAVLPVWMAADAANIAAISAGGAAENIVTFNWINAVGNIGGAGCTLGLVLLCLFFSKSKRYKEMGKLAIVPSLFNINEPVVFGMPCMLNPILAIPFIFTPVVLIGLSYVLTIVHILPIGNGVGAPVAIPGISGLFIGGIRMAIWQVAEFVLSILIYLPFFKKLDANAIAEESNMETK